MKDSLQDVRFTLRLLRKEAFLTSMAVLSLALGIGANTAIFSMVRKTLFAPLPVKAPKELVEVFTSGRDGSAFSLSSYSDYLDLRQRSDLFAGLAASAPLDLTVMDQDGSEVVPGEVVTGNYFQVLGVDLPVGRPFTAEEVETAVSDVVVLSHGFWTRRLGSDPAVVGRTLQINSRPFTVLGVAPADFRGLRLDRSPALWIGMVKRPELMPSSYSGRISFEDRSSRWLDLTGRLQPGTDIRQTGAALRTVAGQLAAAYPASNRGRVFSLTPASSAMLSGPRRSAMARFLGMLLATTGCALLIACANVANLLLVRALGRQREIAVRLTLGATRWKLLRQLLTESLVLSLLGAMVGLLLAAGSLRLLSSVSLPGNIVIGRLSVGLDVYALAWACLLGIATGIFFGLAPALQSSKPELTTALKNQSGSPRPGLSRLRDLLVMAQVASCLLLLVGAGLFARSLWNALTFESGMASEEVALARVDLGLHGYDPQRALAFYQRIREQLAGRPHVESVSVVNALPILQASARFSFKIDLEGYQPRAGEDMNVGLVFAGPGYFHTTGTRLVKGREFSEADGAGAPKVVLVNEKLARRFWGTTEVLGKRLRPSPDEPFMEIVGVTADVKDDLQGGVEPRFFLPLEQYMDYAGMGELILVVRSQGDPARVFPLIREAVHTIDPTLPSVPVSSFQSELATLLRPQRTGLALLSAFSLVALVLVTVGIYGVVAYQVRQRQREIGIRLSLGAERPAVLRLVLRWGLVPTCLGMLAGFGAALLLTRLVAHFLYGISATDAPTYAASAFVVLAVAVAASYLPARRATRVDPAVVLRYE